MRSSLALSGSASRSSFSRSSSAFHFWVLRVEPPQRLDRLGQVRLEAQQALPDVDDLLGVLRTRLGRPRHLDAHRDAPLGIGLGLLRRRQHRQQLRQVVAGVRRTRGRTRPSAGWPGSSLRTLRKWTSACGVWPSFFHSSVASCISSGTSASPRLERDASSSTLASSAQSFFSVSAATTGRSALASLGVRLQRLAEVGQRLVGLAQLLRQLGGGDLGQRALLAALRQRGARGQQRQQLVGPVAPAQEPFQVLAGAAVLGIQLQAAPQVRLAFGRVGPVLQIHLGHRDEQAGGHRRIGGVLGLLQVARGDGLPVGGDQGHLRQPLRRGRRGRARPPAPRAGRPAPPRRAAARRRGCAPSRAAARRAGALSVVHGSSRSMSCTHSSKSPRSRCQRRASARARARASGSTPAPLPGLSPFNALRACALSGSI